MPTTSATVKPTSLKLPAGLKAQLEELARNAGLSLHALLVQTLADSVRREQLRDAFAQEAANALSAMKSSGMGHELADVRAHFLSLSEHRKGRAPKPQALRATRLP